MSKRRRTTVIDVARVAGVSKSTVSLVLQGSLSISAETRARVNRAIRDLGYLYNRGAASLRQSRSRTIGMVIHDLTNSYFAELAVGMDRVVQSAGFVQFMAHSGENLDKQTQVIATMRENGIAGLMLSPVRTTKPADLAALVEAGLPVVLVGRAIPGARVSSLVSDNAIGAQMAVRHLIGLGYRRIAFIGGYADTSIFGERLAGYRTALNEGGLPEKDTYVIPTNPGRDGGVMAVETMLKLHPRVEAALCFNDNVAFGAMDALRASNVVPGRDIGIVGFDDLIAAKAAVPALTTVSTDPQGMGERAAQLLLQQISSGEVTPVAHICPVRLVIRESCGATSASAG